MPQGPFLREYGTEAIIPFVLFEVDGVDFRSDATPATADASVMIDEGAVASATNIYVDEGVGYSITLTATEMLGARIIVYMVDAATKAYLDDSLTIETYGSASAMHQFPFGTATVTVGANNDKTAYSISGTKTTLDALTDGSGVTVTTSNDKTGYSISGSKTTLDALTDGSGVTVTTNSDKTGYSISGTITTLDGLENLSGGSVWTIAIDGTVTAGQSLIISNTILAGKVSGGSSTTATFRDLADGKDRIVVIFTVDGDKTSVTMSDLT